MKSNKENIQSLRKMTVTSKYVSNRYHVGTYYPALLVKGKWLTACGFNIGDKVVLKVSSQKIVIELASSTTIQP